MFREGRLPPLGQACPYATAHIGTPVQPTDGTISGGCRGGDAGPLQAPLRRAVSCLAYAPGSAGLDDGACRGDLARLRRHLPEVLVYRALCRSERMRNCGVVAVKDILLEALPRPERGALRCHQIAPGESVRSWPPAMAVASIQLDPSDDDCQSFVRRMPVARSHRLWTR